jgi:hypothetical protein
MFAADDHMTVRSDWRSLDFFAERHRIVLSFIAAIRARLKHDCLALGLHRPRSPPDFEFHSHAGIRHGRDGQKSAPMPFSRDD